MVLVARVGIEACKITMAFFFAKVGSESDLDWHIDLANFQGLHLKAFSSWRADLECSKSKQAFLALL
jgi:hypothetical protein